MDKIKVQLGTGDLPPVIYGAGYNLLDLVLAKDLAVDLTPYVEADAEWKALYSDTSLITNTLASPFPSFPITNALPPR